MFTKSVLTKALLLAAGAGLLAAGVEAQSSAKRRNAIWYQDFIGTTANGGGGPTGVGGGGGVITGPKPNQLSPVVVTTPVAVP